MNIKAEASQIPKMNNEFHCKSYKKTNRTQPEPGKIAKCAKSEPVFRSS